VEDQVHHRLEIGVEEADGLLRRQPLGQRGEAAQIRHHHGDSAQLPAELEPLGRAQQGGHDVVGHVASEGLADERAARLRGLELREVVRGVDDAPDGARAPPDHRAREEDGDLTAVADLVDGLPLPKIDGVDPSRS